nr:hypothetical protein [Xanthomonas fragariae]
MNGLRCPVLGGIVEAMLDLVAQHEGHVLGIEDSQRVGRRIGLQSQRRQIDALGRTVLLYGAAVIGGAGRHAVAQQAEMLHMPLGKV